MSDPKTQTTNPKRIQRKRTRGWKMPQNTVYVGRGSKWGNPYVVGNEGIRDNEDAVMAFKEMLKYGSDEVYPMEDKIISELRGKNLSCWCKESEPCHADVLLEIANG